VQLISALELDSIENAVFYVLAHIHHKFTASSSSKFFFRVYNIGINQGTISVSLWEWGKQRRRGDEQSK